MLINRSLHIGSVQQVMGFLASGFAKVGGVELLDGGVLVGLADGVIYVTVVEHLCAESADIHGVADIARLLGLAAAVYTAAGASHDLDKVVVGLAGLYFI